jgi:hypothetical protein
MRTLKQLQTAQPTDVVLHEVKDEVIARGMITSKSSASWGAGHPIDDIGDWVRLASPSPSHKDDKQIIFVCEASLVGHTGSLYSF